MDYFTNYSNYTLYAGIYNCRVKCAEFLKYIDNTMYASDKRLRFKLDGKLHRINGPAYVRYYNDQIQYESFWFNDCLHNVKGPACIYYSENGELFYQSYWIHGKEIL